MSAAPPDLRGALLALAAVTPDAAPAVALDDPAALLVRARREGLLPLVAHRLLELGPPAPFAPLALQLRAVVMENARRRAAQWAALAAVGGAFDDAGIEWALLGGFTLAETHYPAAARAGVDLDLLVAPAQQAHARAVLARLLARPWHPAYRDVVTLGEVTIDLHRGPTEAARHPAWQPVLGWPAEDLLARRVRREYRGVAVWEPDFADRVRALALHLVKHGFEALVWSADLDRLIRGAGARFPWATLIARARGRARLLPLVALALAGTEARWGTPIPPEWRAALDSGGGGAWGRRARRSACAAAPHPRLGEWAAFAWLPGGIARARLAFELLFPHPKVLRETAGVPWPRRPGLRARRARVRQVLVGLWRWGRLEG